MATAITRGSTRFLDDRKFENYESMKKYFSAMYTNGTTEIIFDGFQTLTNAAANLEPGDLTIAPAATEIVAFVSTLADDSNQDLKDIWVEYQSDDGIVHGPILHLLNDTADTSVEACLGNEDVNDTIASGQGTTACVMTALAGTTLNQYKDLYLIVQSGNEVRDVHLITASSLATPTTLTVDPALGAAADADIAQIQEFPCDDFYRLRRMWCEIEVLTDKTIRLGDHDSSNYYGLISQGGRYSTSARYFSRDAATARCFLGRIHAHCSNETTVSKKQGNEFQVTFTPKAESADATASDITINVVFQDHIDWQPCFELEPATDVNIKVLTLDNTNVDDAYFTVQYLEANLV